MTEPPPALSEEATAALLDNTAKDPMGQHVGTVEGEGLKGKGGKEIEVEKDSEGGGG